MTIRFDSALAIKVEAKRVRIKSGQWEVRAGGFQWSHGDLNPKFNHAMVA
jgi:hypothetical protein